MTETPWYERVSIPVLLRHARATYGTVMREALEGAGYDDIPKNGLYVIGGLAQETGNTPLARIIDDLGLSKQAAGQLVDMLVARGYLERRTDPQDRRRLIVSLTERGRDAARVQTRARDGIDRALGGRIGDAGILAMRKVLAAAIGLARDAPAPPGRAAQALRVQCVVPILFVSDVRRTARFFADKLGFETDFLYGDPPFYGSVSRDGACVHLRFVHHPNFTDLAAQEESLILASVEVSDVHAIHSEFETRGVDISRELVEQVWGGTDFHVRDPDGNEISFVQYREPEPADEGRS